MTRADYAIGGLLALLVLCGVLFLAAVVVDACTMHTVTVVDGEVVTTSYSPGSVGVGTGMSSSGRSVTVVTSEAERSVALVKIGEHTVKVDVPRDSLADLKPGTRVRCAYRSGRVGLIKDWRIEAFYKDQIPLSEVKQ